MAASIMPLLHVAMHTAIIYIFLITGLRVIGHRQLGQLNVIDLVVIILLGSAIETSMVAGNTTLQAGLVSAATLFLLNRGLTALAFHSRRLRRLVAGHTTLLVNGGEVVEENMKRAGVTPRDLEIAIRARGHCDITDIRYAVMETDGSINVVPFDDSPEPLQSSVTVGAADTLPTALPTAP